MVPGQPVTRITVEKYTQAEPIAGPATGPACFPRLVCMILCIIQHALEIHDYGRFVSDYPGIVS